MPRHVQRPPDRLAPAHRDDLGAGLERVQPLRRGREPRADDGDGGRVGVRLVGVDDPRVAAQLLGKVEARVAGRDEHVLEHPMAADLEAAVDRRDGVDPGLRHALVPAAALAQPAHVREELVHRRVEAVGDRLEERQRGTAVQHAAEGEPGKRGRPAVAVALGAHLALADGRCARPPGRHRVGVVAEDGDLRRLEPACAQGLVRGEAREPRSHHRNRAHFTEPASSPCTK